MIVHVTVIGEYLDILTPSKGVQPVARGLHVAQGGYGCGLKTFFGLLINFC